MLDIEFLKQSDFFDHISIKRWETIFDSWGYDDYLYIILSWVVSVEKYTTSEKKETKSLAILGEWGLFWEASVTSFLPKDVRIIVKEDVLLLKIEAKEWIRSFIQKYPVKWLELMKYIIALTNRRLLSANRQIIANYEMNKNILEIDKIDNRSIFLLIEKFKYIIWCEYILYFKSNPYLPNYTTLVYDTRLSWLLSHDPIELSGTSLNINDVDVNINKYNLVNRVYVWSRTLWFIVFWKETIDFNDIDKKNISSIITWLSWIINQKSILDEERDKNFLKWES